MRKDLCEKLKLYIITDPKYGDIIENTIKVLECGCRAVQLRLKGVSDRKTYEIARKLRNITTDYSALLIINDRVDIALMSDADGVHVGDEDLPAEKIKELFPHLIVGSTVRSLEDAKKIERFVDYIGVGSVFMSKTKAAKIIGISELKKITENVDIPVVAIGGINLSNINEVLACGVCGVAVVSAVFESYDICESTRKFLEIVSAYRRGEN